MRRLVSLLLALSLLSPACLAAESPPAVSAASAILVDARSGRVLYEKDARTRRLIASTTKLMTALVAVESTPLDAVVTVEPEHQAEGSSMYLRAGEELTLKELLYGLLLASGNDAALAIADGCAGSVADFVDWMNQRARSLGMADTRFANPSGLDDEDHYSTAYDLSLLARAALENGELMEIVSTRSATVAGRSLTNHNKLLWRYDGCLGMKTGYTNAAGRTLVSCAQRDGQTLVCVTLNDRDDWADHAALLDYGFAVWPSHTLARAGKAVRTLPTAGSLLPQVEVVTAADVVYPLAAGERLKARFDLPARAAAPVREGAIAGSLTFFLGEEAVGRTYLLYASDVPENTPRPSLFARMGAFLRGEGETACLAALFLAPPAEPGRHTAGVGS